MIVETAFYSIEFFDLKARYEESDHFLARSLRFVTDKITELVGKSICFKVVPDHPLYSILMLLLRLFVFKMHNSYSKTFVKASVIILKPYCT